MPLAQANPCKHRICTVHAMNNERGNEEKGNIRYRNGIERRVYTLLALLPCLRMYMYWKSRIALSTFYEK